MTHASRQVFWIRSTAKLLFAAVLFLVVASFLALPCLHAESGQFRSVAAPSCNQQKIFKPQVDMGSLFQTLPAEPPLRFLAVLTLVAGLALAALTRPPEFPRLRRRWRIRPGTLPFATSDPPHLPYFAALRAA